MAPNMLRFYEEKSCGDCMQCWGGCETVVTRKTAGLSPVRMVITYLVDLL